MFKDRVAKEWETWDLIQSCHPIRDSRGTWELCPASRTCSLHKCNTTKEIVREKKIKFDAGRRWATTRAAPPFPGPRPANGDGVAKGWTVRILLCLRIMLEISKRKQPKASIIWRRSRLCLGAGVQTPCWLWILLFIFLSEPCVFCWLSHRRCNYLAWCWSPGKTAHFNQSTKWGSLRWLYKMYWKGILQSNVWVLGN